MKDNMVFKCEEADNGIKLFKWENVYQYINGNDEETVQLVTFIRKFCEYLNYPKLNGVEDINYACLGGWLYGWAYAKGYTLVFGKETVTATGKGLSISFELC